MLYLLLVQVPVFSQSQPPPTINASFREMPLLKALEQIEAQSQGYRFYYDSTGFDSITINLSISSLPLPQALERLLTGTGLFQAIDEYGNVFITRGRRIINSLPDGLVSPNSPGKEPRPTRDSLVDYGFGSRKIVKTTTQSKLYEIGTKANRVRGVVLVTGYARNSRTGQPITNVSIFTDNAHATVTDRYGYYSITLPAGSNQLNVLAIGMKDARFQLMIYTDGRLDLDLQEQVTTLKEVTVSSRKTINISRVQMGVDKLTIEQIKRIPTVFGETDILRAITSLPGVKTAGEASTGFNVRGGSTDQNLILFNDATIYNPAHFFGLFSSFNPEIVKDIELYKSSIPARFGGRLSSVLDISGREGDKKNITGSAGIGLITSRVNIEGPIVKDKTSFLFGGRTTYANWLLKLLPDEYERSRASFQDLNLGISHSIDSSNSLYFTGYFSNDRFTLDSDTTYGYSNRSANVKWKRNFNKRLSGVFTLAFDQYQYNIHSKDNPVNAYQLKFSISQFNLKTDFVYYHSPRHSFDFGLSSLRYKLKPGSYEPDGKASLVNADIIPTETALESGIYFTHRFVPGPKFSLSSGIRYSSFQFLGPSDVNIYVDGVAISSSSLVEVKNYGKGKLIKNYGGPELRFSARYSFDNSFSIKAGFNSSRQYIHVLSNTTIVAPTDIWKLSDRNIRPQAGNQVSLGFYKNIKSNTIETSLEIYYKKIKDYLDYKPGATLILNHAIEQDVINTNGKAYGAELLIRKTSGKLNGWISYTYSRILLRSRQTEQDVLVNQGKDYPANYDKPHDITLTGNFRVNHRFSLSLNSTYSTGRPITLPVGRYYYNGSERVLYSNRNEYRIPDYMRTDFSMNVEGNHKVNQRTHNSWTFGLYNLLGRRNPYSVYFISENGGIKGYKLSIFGNVIPFINYNIRF